MDLRLSSERRVQRSRNIHPLRQGNDVFYRGPRRRRDTDFDRIWTNVLDGTHYMAYTTPHSQVITTLIRKMANCVQLPGCGPRCNIQSRLCKTTVRLLTTFVLPESYGICSICIVVVSADLRAHAWWISLSLNVHFFAARNRSQCSLLSTEYDHVANDP